MPKITRQILILFLTNYAKKKKKSLTCISRNPCSSFFSSRAPVCFIRTHISLVVQFRVMLKAIKIAAFVALLASTGAVYCYWSGYIPDCENNNACDLENTYISRCTPGCKEYRVFNGAWRPTNLLPPTSHTIRSRVRRANPLCHFFYATLFLQGVHKIKVDQKRWHLGCKWP
ncbi:hypothetical protein EDD21DRAFT_4341 [Dissophora ornata]|nr:hypothetical protein EDD21DRAFT_4341 [Dissophora ornata]